MTAMTKKTAHVRCSSRRWCMSWCRWMPRGKLRLPFGRCKGMQQLRQARSDSMVHECLFACCSLKRNLTQSTPCATPLVPGDSALARSCLLCVCVRARACLCRGSTLYPSKLKINMHTSSSAEASIPPLPVRGGGKSARYTEVDAADRGPSAN
jgi:hypothetical protein